MRELKWLQPIAKVLGIAQNTPTHKLGDCDMMTTLKKKTLHVVCIGYEHDLLRQEIRTL